MGSAPSSSLLQDAQLSAERLNRECFCITLDRDALCEALEREVGDPDFCATFIRTRPHLFSNVPVFLSESDVAEMLRIVRAVEAVARLPGYRDAVLSWAPEARAPRPWSAWRVHGLRLSSRRGRTQVDRGEYERRWRLPERVAGSSPACLLRRGRGRADAIRKQ